MSNRSHYDFKSSPQVQMNVSKRKTLKLLFKYQEYFQDSQHFLKATNEFRSFNIIIPTPPK